MYCFVCSTLSHKEFRFLMGILPLVMHVCGNALHQYLDISSVETCSEKPLAATAAVVATAASADQDVGNSQPKIKRIIKSSVFTTVVMIFLIAINLFLGLYTCLIHQRGTIDAVTFLYLESQKPTPETMNVLYLMPCHSTPYYR